MDFPELARESQEVWERNARWWDARMGEGDRWHTQLIWPAIERLLPLKAGERVVDLACGNGWLARRLARKGARVMGCDFSPTHVECARARATPDARATREPAQQSPFAQPDADHIHRLKQPASQQSA